MNDMKQVLDNWRSQKEQRTIKIKNQTVTATVSASLIFFII